MFKSLKNINTDTIDLFSFNGKRIQAKVSDVIDGDTIKVVFRWKNEFVKYKVRFSRINCMELNSKNQDEKLKADEAKNYVNNLLNKKIVLLECQHFDKYGRILANVYFHDVCVNDLLVTEKLAVYKKY